MIHEVLRLLRVFHDLKAKDLAEKLSISPSYLSEIENGKKEPTLELLNKYSVVFNMPVSSIFLLSEGTEKQSDKKSFKGSLSKLIINFLHKVEGEENAHSSR
ncbi:MULTISPECIES: helix-turn-helix transcriptional regulator [Leptospira]|uniref:DNA-binding helix-turn-helix protein n=5 Tax=Leptospira TaxID=171 RepID=A0AA87MM68_9LEPT|nr:MULTISPECIES: helix-turn-helix transcriptional regulator [Leptospira]EMO61099.1 DNA-binding helix-turn-helix protein [Leptospira borgpetersenii serovar Pomona str. 200901868]ABJ76330.1 Transcriptional regulator [Leptospira borgpetersenii serovar Hardjo-bovis str. JB197]ABJ78605.1 Transcriptional regulator [Leptospira borgpetersenii serovar Hardjo-bovis str. L550]AMX57876.1 transcriptional regulator [Leptospira borgpetersenii serovar Hardjo]AMX61108.1 transcriptional regulator [Leptospira bo